ncbi:MAG: hypothetical protein LC664_12725 [Flavobacteriales bacterium]|nr:hypothetical protein [Flavobacteriales bacterium]
MYQKTHLIIIICFFFSLLVSAQNGDSRIKLEGKGMSQTFVQNSRILRPKDLVEITREYPEAHAFMKKAKTNSDFASVVGFVGGGLIGIPVGAQLGGGEPNWILAGVGAAVLVMAIPLSSGFKNNAEKGAEIYNQAIAEASSQKPILNFVFMPHGAGFQLTF